MSRTVALSVCIVSKCKMSLAKIRLTQLFTFCSFLLFFLQNWELMQRLYKNTTVTSSKNNERSTAQHREGILINHSILLKQFYRAKYKNITVSYV
jgi:hypothetical protein